MKGKTFLLVSALTFITFCTAYFLAVDRLAIIDRKIPFTYRQFLLEASSDVSGKIVIESGSNSLHAFDAIMIEEHFNRSTIVLGDNAGYPISHKLHNIERHLNAGDSLVLPLEWGYYIRSDVFSQNYIDRILSNRGTLSVYYQDLPLAEKIRFIFGDISLGRLFESIVNSNGPFNSNSEVQISYGESYSRLVKTFKGNSLSLSKNGNSIRNIAPSKNEKINRSNCDQYLFSGLVDPARKRFSKYFIEDLNKIKSLSERLEVKVYFSWPTVVQANNSSPCYGKLYNRYIKEVENDVIHWVEQAGFSFIDIPQDNAYPAVCYLNTHYHIKQECQEQRTQKLIADLYSAGLRKTALNDLHKGRKIIGGQLDDYSKIVSEMYDPIVNGEKYRIEDMKKSIRLLSGWSFIEKSGLWSLGHRSEIAVNLSVDSPHIMKIRGQYFNEKEHSKVWVGGHYLGEYDLSRSSIELPEDLGPGETLIVFEYKNPLSPKALGKSSDQRPLKFFLSSLQFK